MATHFKPCLPVSADGVLITCPRPLARRPTSARRAAKGAVAIVFAASLILIMGVFGLALDLTRLFNRQAELQNVADAAAMAAARELNGTAAGLTAAAAKARSAAEALRYQYDSTTVTWSDAALRFGATPNATTWLDLADATLNPRLLRYAKVETGALGADSSSIGMFFIQVVAPAMQQAQISTRAIAGRTATNVLPLAICAMSATPAEGRTHAGPPEVIELVEYGFRRGVAYDLMQLNPAGTSPENFIVDPFAIPEQGNVSSNTTQAVVGPHICTGSVVLPRVLDANIAVTRQFPLAQFYKQLNSRFDTFYAKDSGAYCSPDIAPPDTNIKAYPFDKISWMTTVPAGQAARSSTEGGKLGTVADLVPPASAATTAPMYGPLWSFARAVPFASYQAGTPEPAAGYAAFASSNWTSLYKPGQPVPRNYPASGTPYAALSGDTYMAPSAQRKGLRNRRILNVPLLACPVSGTTPAAATVVAIARFFMTVPATATQLNAEFGGVVSNQTIGGNVELYP